MKIINKPMAEIRPYENNPRINDGAIAAVTNSIREFGFRVPIIISADNEIVAGHTRYAAAKTRISIHKYIMTIKWRIRLSAVVCLYGMKNRILSVIKT